MTPILSDNWLIISSKLKFICTMYNHRIFYSLFSLILFFSCEIPEKKSGSFLMTITGNVKGSLNPVQNKYDKRGGLARKATVINSYKNEGLKPIILDAGNLFTDSCDVNTIIQCYNKIGYNVLNVGVNDLSANIDLKLIEKDAKFTFISSNIVFEGSNKTVFDEYIILKRSGFRIAIIGLTSAPNKLLNEKYQVLDVSISGKKTLDKIIDLSDYQVILFCGSYQDAKKIQSQLTEVDFIFVSGDTSPPRKNHLKNTGAFIQRVGDLGQFIIAANTNISHEDSSLIDISALIERRRFVDEKLHLATSGKSNEQIQQLYGEDYDPTQKINHMESELNYTNKQLMTLTNTVQFEITQLASIIPDENEITQIINTANNNLK